MRWRAWVGIAAIGVWACTSSGGPTGTGGGLQGSFAGTHAFSFGGVPTTCQGTLVVTNVNAGRFSGTLTINPCPPLSTTVITFLINGTIAGQALSFTFIGQDQFIQSIEDQLDCTVTRVDQSFTGTFTSGRVQATFTATVACPGQPSSEFSWAIDMLKSS